MDWFKKPKFTTAKIAESRLGMPDGVWQKCTGCGEILYTKEVEKNLKTCPKCGYHFRLSSWERINLLVDEGTFKPMGDNIHPIDPLGFKDTKRYRDRLASYQKSTNLTEAAIVGEGKIENQMACFGVLEYGFMGGSMGSVVGEKISRIIEQAIKKKCPLVITSSSGGARMQEAILSLMQMVKTSAALAKLNEARQPYISILTDPTTGGVTASFAMLGDVNIAEPGALIGFAGPRVIEQTIRQTLPEGFQRSEFLLEHGMIDMVVNRKDLKRTVAKLIRMLK
ncbi:MAG: acetyl-CoA carboxylase, carboxyltransferase subunit beta [bacterium]